MQAIILAGGMGMRLRPFTVTIPKPLLPLGDRPIIDVILSQLRADDFSRVTICLGYLAPLFQAFLGDGSRWGLNIEYVLENEPLGTAGALRMVPRLDDDFIVLNGDTLTDLSFAQVFDAHFRAKAYATIFAAAVEDFVDYGVVEFDEDSGIIERYIEKPKRKYHVSTGIYVLSKRIMRFDPGVGKFDMPDLLRMAFSNGEKVQCHLREDAYWRDIGRFDHYEAATQDFLADPARFLRTPVAPEAKA